MIAQADSPATTASRERRASAPTTKPPSSQGLAALAREFQGGGRRVSKIAVAAPIARPITAAASSTQATSRVRLSAVGVDASFGECVRALDSRILSSLSEAARGSDRSRGRDAPVRREDPQASGKAE
jgi:hypothetical protein